MKDGLGKQTILELYGCKKELLNDLAFIEKTILSAAKSANATIIKHFFHQFSPFGISGTVIIAESHVCIHTWPEHNFAAVDIFTCSEKMDNKMICDTLIAKFEAKDSTMNTITRGNMKVINKADGLQIQNRHQ